MIKKPALRFNSIVQMVVEDQLGAMQLSDWCTGVVSKVNPLEITTNQKNIIPAEYLILTNAVKDHDVDITVSWSTVSDDYLKTESTLYSHTHAGQNYVGNMGKPIEGEADPMDSMKYNTIHHHDIKGRKKITIHNGLTLGEKVILLRETGGQRYVVLDRTSPHVTTGECV